MNRIVISLLGFAVCAGFALASVSARAQFLPPPQAPGVDQILPLAWGQLDDGRWVEGYEFTIGPGESTGWHYHPGTVQAVVLSGSLTEDRGCGAELVTHPAGDAFTEEPGVVHNVIATGITTVFVAGVLAECWGDAGQFNDYIAVVGPTCEGNSHRARREHVGCP